MDLQLALTDARVSSHRFAAAPAVFPAAVLRLPASSSPATGPSLIAYFARDICTLVAQHLLEAGVVRDAAYDDSRDTWVFHEADGTRYEVEGVTIRRADGWAHHLYGIGAGVWPWDDADARVER